MYRLIPRMLHSFKKSIKPCPKTQNETVSFPRCPPWDQGSAGSDQTFPKQGFVRHFPYKCLPNCWCREPGLTWQVSENRVHSTRYISFLTAEFPLTQTHSQNGENDPSLLCLCSHCFCLPNSISCWNPRLTSKGQDRGTVPLGAHQGKQVYQHLGEGHRPQWTTKVGRTDCWAELK